MSAGVVPPTPVVSGDCVDLPNPQAALEFIASVARDNLKHKKKNAAKKKSTSKKVARTKAKKPAPSRKRPRRKQA